MDAAGLWFSKLESNFYADYGQFRWTEEQRTWDWDNLTTVDLVSTKDGTKRLVLNNTSFKFNSLPYNRDHGNEEGACS